MAAAPRIHYLKSLAEVRGLTHPLRMEIIKRLQLSAEPLSATRLGQEMGQGPTKLHYHLVELERLGLIRLAEQRKKGNLVEKCYAPSADGYRVDPALFTQGAAGALALHDTVTTVLETTADEIRRLFAQAPDPSAIRDQVVPAHTAFALSAEDAALLRERLRSVLLEFKDRQIPGGQEHAVSIVVYPQPGPAPQRDHRRQVKRRP